MSNRSTLPVRLGAASLLAASMAAPSIAWPADMVVRVRNVGQGAGGVRVAVYESSGFLRKPIRSESAQADSGVIEVRFRDLPAGTYAVSAFQDTDGNQRLTTNSMGIPDEPYGMSRDAKGRFGPPVFDDAKVALSSGGIVVDVKLARP